MNYRYWLLCHTERRELEAGACHTEGQLVIRRGNEKPHAQPPCPFGYDNEWVLVEITEARCPTCGK